MGRRKEPPQPRVAWHAFEDAVRVFEGPTVERVDDRFDYDERRIYVIGLVNGLEITVIYTDRTDDEDALFRRGVPSHTNGAITGRASKARANES